MDNIMPVIVRDTDWSAMLMLIVSAVIIILLIATQLIYPDYYRTTLYRMFVENFSGRQITKRTEISYIVVISTVESFLSLSAMAYGLICYSGITSINISDGNEAKTFLLIIGICIAYTFLKLFINYILGEVFRLSSYAKSYNTLILDTERILGLTFIPIVAFCPFVSLITAKILIWIGLVLTVLFVGFQFVTFFLHLLKNKFLNHQSILYFCGLEVMPVLILIKLIF